MDSYDVDIGFDSEDMEEITADRKFPPLVLVDHIDTFGKGLSAWEINFIANLIDNPPDNYSKKQIKIIDRIYEEKCK